MPILEILVGGAIGVVGALGGSWLQNRYDAKQRERERQLSLRRDVYLEAAEGLAGLQEYLGGMADPARPMDQLAQAIKGRPGWQNKIHVVASLPTINAFAEADGYFVSAAVSAIPLRYEIDQAGRQLASLQEREEQLKRYQGYLHTSLQAQIQQLPAHDAVAAANQLRQAIDRVQQDIASLESDQGQLLDQRARNMHRLLIDTLERVAQHRILTARALLAVRREIDLPLPEFEYVALMERTNREVLDSLNRLLPKPDDSGTPET